MTTLQITHSSFINHDTGEWHPERPERMKAIEQALSTARFQNLITVEAPAATPDQVARAHPRAYVDQLEKKQPKTDLIALDEGVSGGIRAQAAIGPVYAWFGLGVVAWPWAKTIQIGSAPSPQTLPQAEVLVQQGITFSGG